jgi:hyperosmotically inducible periplasmic protein
VSTLHGVVQLSGSVDTAESKQRAEVIASTTEGVTDVRNHLKVRGTGAATPPADSAVVAGVRQALHGHPAVQARDIGVNRINADTVELVGVVGSPHEKATASQVAVAVNGVRHVENSLTVAALHDRISD